MIIANMEIVYVPHIHSHTHIRKHIAQLSLFPFSFGFTCQLAECALICLPLPKGLLTRLITPNCIFYFQLERVSLHYLLICVMPSPPEMSIQWLVRVHTSVMWHILLISAPLSTIINMFSDFANLALKYLRLRADRFTTISFTYTYMYI